MNKNVRREYIAITARCVADKDKIDEQKKCNNSRIDINTM